MTDFITLNEHQFSFGGISYEGIYGWAYKTGHDEYAPLVEVKSGDELLWKTRANKPRKDLKAAGIGNGHYAFHINPSNKPISDKVEAIDLYIDGLKVNAEPIPFSVPMVNLEQYRIFIESESIQGIEGWVAKNDNPQHKPVIELRSGSALISKTIANGFRQDLADADIGDGHCTFELVPNIDSFPAPKIECFIYVDGAKLDKAFTFEITEAAFEEAKFRAKYAVQVQDYKVALEKRLLQMKATVVDVNRLAGKDDLDISGQLQVAISTMAELSVRMEVLEKAMLKHFD